MAEALAIKVLTDVLTSFIPDGLKLLIKTVIKPGRTQEEIKALVSTYEQIQLKISQTSIPDDWLIDVVTCCYDVEDIIDCIHLASMKNASSKMEVPQTHEKHIEALRAKLNEKLSKWPAAQPAGHGFSRQSCSSLEPRVCELLRGGLKTAIIEELRSRQFGVSIIGPYGIGKTTIARAIVEDARIAYHFPIIRKPVGVFNLKSVLKELSLEEQIHENQRVLIVLDGLQTVTASDWHQFRHNFLDKLNSGSKVLITTRNPNVALITGTSKLHLHPLEDDECMKLICSSAGANDNLSREDLDLINLNKRELINKCNGSPLLACHLGLILSAAEDRRAKVEEIERANLWELLNSLKILPKKILPADLMPELLAKQLYVERSLVYCSLFPQDHTFNKGSLVELWMAEGFVKAKREDHAIPMERTASEYFDVLLELSIFQSQSDKQSIYKMCKLTHALAEDMALKVVRRVDAGILNCTSSLNDDDVTNIRHLSFSCENTQNTTEIKDRVQVLLSRIGEKSKALRTFLLLHKSGRRITKNPTFFKELKFLRVLDLSHTNLTNLAPKISKLKHLRYLDLSNTCIQSLPSLVQLIALRVLKLTGCNRLSELPDDISKLTNLVCLQVSMAGLDRRPQNIGKLTKLQTLDVFMVGEKKPYKIVELKNMDSLRKSICIRELENVKNGHEAREAMLHNKKELEALELQWTTPKTDAKGKQSAEEVIQGLQPSTHLKELTIAGYQGTRFPQWLGGKVVCLHMEKIKLYHCACTSLPSLWQLGRLKTLCIVGLHHLQKIDADFFGKGTSKSKAFPVLESFKLEDLPRVAKWRELSSNCMPLLRDLQIRQCGNLQVLPPLHQLTSLKQLEISCCSKLKELPVLPSSMTLAGSNLIIDRCEKVELTCRVGGSDWEKIKGIPSVRINGIIFQTLLRSEDERSSRKSYIKVIEQVVEAV